MIYSLLADESLAQSSQNLSAAMILLQAIHSVSE